jgi:hypothetical protein
LLVEAVALEQVERVERVDCFKVLLESLQALRTQ